MTMKRLLVSGAAVAVLGLSATAASAQGLLGTGKWYLKGFGGATFPRDADTELFLNGVSLGDGDASFDTGYVLGAAFGAYFTPAVAVELEYAHRRADFDSLSFAGIDVDGDHTRSDSFMLNALYNFPGTGPGGAWQPYAGAGVGTTQLEFKADGDEFTRDWVLAYQLIGGVAFDVSQNVSLLGEVRWFGTEGGRFSGPDDFSAKMDWDTFDLLVGAQVSF